MQALISTKDMAISLGITVRSVNRRAKKEKWSYVWKKCAGPDKKMIVVDLLPDDVRELIKADVFVPTQQSNLPAPQAGSSPLNKAQQGNAMAKADLLRLYLRALAVAPWGQKEQARTDFMTAYNSGLAYTTLYNKLGDLSWKTIEGWKTKLQKNGRDTFSLADRRGYGKKGRGVLTPQQTDILLRCALHPNRPRISEAIRMAKAVMHTRGISNGYADSTYRRWLDNWTSRNYHIWTFSREGAKAWNDKCARYIERDYNLINVGDVIVADGHILNFEITNPWTGKPKRMTLIVWKDMKSNFPLGWEIMPTEDTAAISSALRRAILMLGKMPQVAYLDNGRAFKSRFFNGSDNFDEAGFTGLYERLDMKTIFAWPYHGQSKTVERFFGTFAELERWCPTYTGTSIEKKPPRMNRGEKLHRKAYEKAYGGQVISMEQAHKAIAGWFDEYVHRPQRGHLDGRAPVELFLEEKGDGVDPHELRYLMMSLEVKHIRRNGISFQGQNYYHPELYGRRHPVTIRYDLQDKSALWVFDQDDNFLCAAEPVEKVHPAAAALGNDEDRERLEQHIVLKKTQEKEASTLVRNFLNDEVLPEHRKMLEQQGITDAPGSASMNQEKQIPVKLDEKKIQAEVARKIKETEECEAKALNNRLENAGDRERYNDILQMLAQNQLIPRKWQKWQLYYEETAEYQRHADYWEDKKTAYTIMYQNEAIK